jgi:futalosine hydrolase
MEGAALHFVCLQEGIPFVQLRGISNRVGDREKRNWRIDEAMTRLQESLANLLLRLNEKGTP